MTEMILKKIIELLEPKVKEWLQEAFDVGYKISEEDTSRRMYDMFLRGYASGAVDAYDKLGAIAPEEITPEEFQKIIVGDAN